jgi:hypothetical protein
MKITAAIGTELAGSGEEDDESPMKAEIVQKRGCAQMF